MTSGALGWVMISAVRGSSQGSSHSDAQCALCEIPTHPPIGKQSENSKDGTALIHCWVLWPTFVNLAPRVLPDTLTNPPLRVKYTYIQMYPDFTNPITESILAQEYFV
jgi:hypothetical protein